MKHTEYETIEKAKKILIKTRKVDEPAAHTMLQQESMRHGVTLYRMAVAVIALRNDWKGEDDDKGN